MASAEANKNKLIDQTLSNYPEHKVIHQTQIEIPYDSNKSTQQYIKDLGNDFLKDFIEKNYPNNKVGSMEMNPYSTTSGHLPGASNAVSMNNPNLSHLVNSNVPQQSANGLQGLNGNQMPMSQHSFSMGSNLPQITGLSQFNQFNPGVHNPQLNQKRPYQNYDKDLQVDFELKNEQLNDMSVKKFKSGEDLLCDIDFDKSKRELEDFIYKTHNAIKNNTYRESKLLVLFLMITFL